jgi:hypothetical protein
MLIAALRMCIACWHPHAVNCSSPLLPDNTANSLVETNELITLEVGSNNNDNGNYYEEDEDEISEMCEEVYDESLKCESALSSSVTQYPQTNGCTFINKALTKMEKASQSASNRSSSGGGGGASASTVFAWIFGLSTLGLGAFVYQLLKKQSDHKQALLGGMGADYGNGRSCDGAAA